jgi:hypothetical protein
MCQEDPWELLAPAPHPIPAPATGGMATTPSRVEKHGQRGARGRASRKTGVNRPFNPNFLAP